MADTEKLQIVLRSWVSDDPFAGQDSQYVRDFKQFMAVVETHGGRIVPPRLTMDSATIQTVLEFVHPLTRDALKILGAALVAWVHGQAGRQTEASGFGIKVKANSAEEVERIIDKLSAVKKSNHAKDKKHDCESLTGLRRRCRRWWTVPANAPVCAFWNSSPPTFATQIRGEPMRMRWVSSSPVRADRRELDH